MFQFKKIIKFKFSFSSHATRRYAESRHHFFDVSGFGRVTHLRLNMFPDGGIARLRVHGRVSPNWDTMAPNAEVDLCSVLNGGLGISCR